MLLPSWILSYTRWKLEEDSTRLKNWKRFIDYRKIKWFFMPHPSHLHILNIQADEKYTSKYIFFKRNNNFLLSQIRHDKPLSTTNNSFVSEQATTSEQLRKQSLLPPPLQTCFIRSRSTFQFPVYICSNRGPVYQRDEEEEEEEEEASYSFALHASTTWSRYRFPYIPSPGNTYREFKCLRWLDGWTAGRGLACFDGGKLASLADRVSRG